MSGFEATHIKGRCIDYIFGNVHCKRALNVKCTRASTLASDHVGLVMTFSKQLCAPQPTTRGVSPST